MAFLAAQPSGGQTNAETNAPGVQLNLSVPGARSLGMGGAFLALADDATAAYANPAGLVLLPAREASLEARFWRYRHVFTFGGTVDGGDLSGLEDGWSSSSQEHVSFASAVFPRRQFSFAAYYHRLADFRAEFDTEGAVVLPQTRLFPASTRLNLEIDSVGLAAAWTTLSRRFSAGVSLAYRGLEIGSETVRFSVRGLESSPDRSPGNVHDSQLQGGPVSTDLAITAGLLYRVNWRTRLAVVFRESSSFPFAASTVRGPRAPEGLAEGRTPQDPSYQLPDLYGMGVSWRAHPRLRLSLDYYLVDYSSLSSDLVDVFLLAEDGLDPQLERFKVRDGHQYHLGLEWLARTISPPLYLRAGVWRDPDHGLRFDGNESSELLGFEAIFRERPDELHLSAGVGFAGRKSQIDFAIDHSDRFLTAALSTVFRF